MVCDLSICRLSSWEIVKFKQKDLLSETLPVPHPFFSSLNVSENEKHNPENDPEKHNPEWTQSQMDTIPNGHNPE